MLITKTGRPFYLLAKENTYGDKTSSYQKISAYNLAHEEIGYLIYHIYRQQGKNKSWLFNINVCEEYLNEGVGHALMCAYEKVCRETDTSVMEGFFEPNSEGWYLADGFYNRHGFEIEEDEDGNQYVVKYPKKDDVLPPVKENKDFALSF